MPLRVCLHPAVVKSVTQYLEHSMWHSSWLRGNASEKKKNPILLGFYVTLCMTERAYISILGGGSAVISIYLSIETNEGCLMNVIMLTNTVAFVHYFILFEHPKKLKHSTFFEQHHIKAEYCLGTLHVKFLFPPRARTEATMQICYPNWMKKQSKTLKY